MPEKGRGRFPDLLVIAQELWGPVQRRNQLLLAALGARNPRSRFLFVERPARPRELLEWRPVPPTAITANVWTFRPLRPVPDFLGKPLSDRAECAQIARAVRAVGLERPLLWTQDPRVADLVDRLGTDGVIYDLTDDWPAFESSPARRASVRARHETLAQRADLVLACSRRLAEQAKTLNRRVCYLPNAVDATPPPVEPVGCVRDLPAPRLGYAGTLHSSRLDVSLLVQAARMRPQWSFVFLGPDHLESTDRTRLFALPNVRHLGACAHEEVLSYVSQFDACLLPHLSTEFTQSLDPLKLYQYLAAGKPVLATPAGIPRELASHVSLVTSAEELVQEAERAIAHAGPAAIASRRAAVAHATWEARAAAIEDELGVAPAPAWTDEVSVVIVSYNTGGLLSRCLGSLHDQEGVKLQTIVVDNGSSDGSAQMVRTRFPEVELIELGDNTGFAHANNVAFERCRGRYVLLLNPDAFLHPGALRELISAAERHPEAAVVGPRLLNSDGTLQRSAWPFPRASRLLLEALGLHRPLRRLGLLEDLGTWDHSEEREVDFLIGACLLLRHDALVEVGGFDERFWLYGEEADLQLRLAHRRRSVILAPAALATHLGAASSHPTSSRRLRHFYAAQQRFLQKHGPAPAFLVGRLALLVGSLIRMRWEVVWIALSL